MNTDRVLKIANQFQESLKKEAQEQAVDYQRVARELNEVVEGFIRRNPMKMATTQPRIQEASENQPGVVAMGFVIPENEFRNYIREINNEVQKLKNKYPTIQFRAFYDEQDPRKADI